MLIREQAWFECDDLKRRRYDTQVWIPLRAIRTTVEAGEPGKPGYVGNFVLAASLMVPNDKREVALTADANDLIQTSNPTAPHVDEDGAYVQAETASSFHKDVNGVRLVLEQRVPGREHTDWQLNQVLVFALNLQRVGDAWIRIEEGRDVVARLTRDGDGKSVLLEIKAEYLKDYLSARGMGLLLGTYNERVEVESEGPSLTWQRSIVNAEDQTNGWRWEGRVQELHDNGTPFGQKMSVFQMARTDFDSDDEVPVLEIEGEVETKQWDVPLGKGPKVYRTSGELWRTQWVNPAAHSPRVRGDDIPSTSYFIVNSAGERKSGDELKTQGNMWLWFRPEIVNDALAHPDGEIVWNTADTASLRFAPDQSVHMGINELGCVNVLAVDIGRLPLWSQAKWAAHNVAPTGKISRELVSIQVEVTIPETIAPESKIKEALDELSAAIKERYGIKLFRGDEHERSLLRSVHRFRSVNFIGLLDLAKDITRLFADRIDGKALQKAALDPQPEKTLGSLKSLEAALATLIPPGKARLLCGALFGIYDLRTSGAHLPSSDLSEELKLANVKNGDPPVQQGHSMLIAFLVSVMRLADIFSDDMFRPDVVAP